MSATDHVDSIMYQSDNAADDGFDTVSEKQVCYIHVMIFLLEIYEKLLQFSLLKTEFSLMNIVQLEGDLVVFV